MSEKKIKDKNNDPFQDIIEKIGSAGHFQLMYTIFLFTSNMVVAMIYLNFLLALNIPDHWCHVPGRNLTNLTETEWRNLTLPKSTNNRGEITFSSCKMYNASYKELVSHAKDTKDVSNMSCIYGYEYDKTWYEETIPTKEDWVCDKRLYAVNGFIATRIGKIIGALFLGYFGDKYGRQVVYYCSSIIVVFGRILTILTTSSIDYFLIASAFAFLTINGFLQMPYIIAIEISNEKHRANITLIAMLSFSIATSILAMIFWILRHWVPFMWVTTLIAVSVLLFIKYSIESPRWLINQKKFTLAIKQFKKIAKMNNKEFKMTEEDLTEIFKDVKKDIVYGMPSLFSSWRLAKNTLIIISVRCLVTVSYFTIMIFTANMGGNPFLIFFFQCLVEIPSFFLGKYLSNTIGRKFSNCLSLFLGSAICIPIILLSYNPKYEYVIICLTILIKFVNGITNFAGGLQEIEMYPTCLRASGIALGGIIVNLISCFSPYIAYLGTLDLRAPYYVLGTCFAICGLGVLICLPETLNEKLPDTLEDGSVFGKEQKFWSIPKIKKPAVEENDNNNDNINETEKLNQEKYSA